jgi:hypothetical protein
LGKVVGLVCREQLERGTTGDHYDGCWGLEHENLLNVMLTGLSKIQSTGQFTAGLKKFRKYCASALLLRRRSLTTLFAALIPEWIERPDSS